MKKRKIMQELKFALTFVLSAAMLVTQIPLTVSAAETAEKGTTEIYEEAGTQELVADKAAAEAYEEAVTGESSDGKIETVPDDKSSEAKTETLPDDSKIPEQGTDTEAVSTEENSKEEIQTQEEPLPEEEGREETTQETTETEKIDIEEVNGAADANGFDIVGGVLKKYTGTAAEVTIPDNVTAIGDNAFNGNKTIEVVVIPGTVETIGGGAFANCTILGEVTLNQGLKTIGGSAFKNVGSEKTAGVMTLTIPGSVEEIGAYAFSGCASLKKVVFEEHAADAQTPALVLGETGVGKAETFSGCKELTEVTLPTRLKDTRTYTFSGCTKLTAVNFTTGSELTTIGENAFSGCTALPSITIPDKVTTIGGGAFANCTILGEVTLNQGLKTIGGSAFKNVGSEKTVGVMTLTIPGSVEEIGAYAFSGCASLKKVVFEEHAADAQTPALVLGETGVGKAETFSGCKELTEVTLPTRLKDTRTYTFSGCTKLTAVNFTSGSELATIGAYAFSGCTALPGITIPDKVTTIADGAFKGDTAIPKIVIPANVETIGGSAFENCTSLGQVTLNQGLKKIGANAFRGVGSEKTAGTMTLTIPGSVEEIGPYAFSGCASLKKVVFEEHAADARNPILVLNNTGVGDSAVFTECKELTEVTLPTRLKDTNTKMFLGCTKLETVNFTSGSELTTIGTYAFNGCTALTSITIPDKVTDIGDNAFHNCTSLGQVTLNQGLKKIGAGAFQSAGSEKTAGVMTLTIPGSVERIGTYAFASNLSLKKVVFEEHAVDTVNPILALDVTGVKKAGTFANCQNLINITFPARLKNLRNNAFESNPKLTALYIPPSVTEIEGNAITGFDASKLTIYGESGSRAESYANEKGIKFINGRPAAVAVESVKLIPETINENVIGKTIQLKAEITPDMADNQKVTYKSDNEQVVTVDANGLVTVIGYGKAKITVTTDDGAKTAKCEVSISEKEGATVKSIKLTPSAIYKVGENVIGKTIQLKAEITPDTADNKKVTYKSDNEQVVTVDTAGLVKVTGYGKAVITVTTEDGGKTAECKVSILEKEAEDKPEIVDAGVTFAGNKITYVYTGEQIRPVMSVICEYEDEKGSTKTQKLKLNTDYTVEYSNNVDVKTITGEPTVTVTGIGEYSGIVTKTFTITQKSISGVALSPVGDIVYGEEPDVVVTDGVYELKKGKDYELDYDKASQDKDTPSLLKVKGIGNYKDNSKKSVKFNILNSNTGAKPIKSNNITIDWKNPGKPYTYNGKPQKPAVIVKDESGKKLSSSQYKVLYSNNVNAGEDTASVRVVGVSKNGSGYYGISDPKTFLIAQKDFSRIAVRVPSAIPKAGDMEAVKRAIAKSITVYDGKHIFREDEYTIDYKEIDNTADIKNIVIGQRYKIILKPVTEGNYLPNSEREVYIKFGQLNLASKTAKVEVTIIDVEDQKITLRYNGITLPDEDYTPTVKQEKNRDTYTVTIKANRARTCAYKGSRTIKNISLE